MVVALEQRAPQAHPLRRGRSPNPTLLLITQMKGVEEIILAYELPRRFYAERDCLRLQKHLAKFSKVVES